MFETKCCSECVFCVEYEAGDKIVYYCISADHDIDYEDLSGFPFFCTLEGTDE